jgi:HlyD family secretion protein
MKNLFLPLVAVGAVIFATASVVRTQPVRAVTDPPRSPPVTTAASAVAGVGLIEASSENIAVGAHIAGVVSEVCVGVGTEVRRGDALIRIDDRSYRAEALVRRADVQLGLARLADAKDLHARAERIARDRVISEEEAERRRHGVAIAQAAVAQAEARLAAIETDIERLTIRAPLDGTVLQVKVRPGEYVPTGALPTPILLLGATDPLHLRVDVDEHDAGRVRADMPAVAYVRGNPSLRAPLRFVRFEPYILPKRSLTGDATERVDTRVLQVIYRLERGDLPVFVGQQMDVFIEASGGDERGRS